MNNWAIQKTDGTWYGFSTAYLDNSPGIGLGMPPLNNVIQPFGNIDGSDYQQTLALQREFTLSVPFGDVDGTGDDIPALHIARQRFIDVIRPDRAATQQELTLRYTGGDKTLYIDAVYQRGLELVATGGTETAPVTFVAPNPYFYGDEIVGASGGSVASLLATLGGATSEIFKSTDGYTFTSTGASVTQIIATGLSKAVKHGDKIYVNFTTETVEFSGTSASTILTTVGPTVYSLAVKSNGNLLIAGNFTNVAGIADADYIAEWDGSSWNAITSGADVLNGLVSAIAVDNRDYIYVLGEFTNAGGVANADGFAYWDGSSWNTYGTPSQVLAPSVTNKIIVDVAYNVYIGGNFTNFGGTATFDYLVKWDGTSWGLIGDTSPNDKVYDIFLDGTVLYATGDFTKIDGEPTGYAAKYENGRWKDVINATPGGGNIYSIVPRGSNVYLAGAFSNFDGDGALETCVQVAPSQSIKPMFIADGTDGIVLKDDTSDDIYVVISRPSDVYGFDEITIENTGTAKANPVMTFINKDDKPRSLFAIVNITTGQEIFFDFDLALSESATLDLSRRSHTDFSGNTTRAITFFSDNRDLISSIAPGSDLTEFYLATGENKLAIYSDLLDDKTIEFNIDYTPRYWSIDGAWDE